LIDGNLAVSTQVGKNYRLQEKKQNKKVKIKHSIPLKEKLFYLAIIFIIVAITALVIYRYAMISQLNYQILQLKQEWQQISEKNAQLSLQIHELSKRERIVEIAEKELGMTFKDSKVRILSKASE
jgi:cell division protein FtsL